MLGRRLGRLVFTLTITTPVILAFLVVTVIAVTPLPPAQNAEATELLDASGKPFERMFTQDRVEIPVIDMPKHLLDAVVAVEDDRFYRHPGIDVAGIARAVVRNVRAGEIVEGGSTLTQQLVKNLYLTNQRTWTRKVREAILALKLEYKYSKKEILGMYLNTIYLGNGVYGVERAAQVYFGKSARQLTIGESALLAGLPRAPEYYAPRPDNMVNAVERRNLVLSKMVEQGYIDSVTAEAAKSEVQLPVMSMGSRQTSTTPYTAPYFVDYVLKELRQRFPEVAANLHQGGYRVYTTLDLKVQAAADQAVGKAMPNTEVALVAMEPSTGYIRAMRGGQSDTVVHNRALLPKQPGSAFKPFVYATALEGRGYTVTDTQLDVATKAGEFVGATAGTEWRPANFNNEYTNKAQTMRYALRKSLNLVTIRWLRTLTPAPVIRTAHRLGIESPLTEDLTLALGSSAVSPLELTRAYAPFANGGFNVLPIAILRVEDHQGNIVAEQRATRSRAIDAGLAFLVTDLLKSALRPGGSENAFAQAIGNRPAAGKTGTTENSTDLWFAGYTPDLVASVWIGSDDGHSLGNNLITGRTKAVPVWADFMNRALTGVPNRDWARPVNVVVQEICSLTGLRPNASCPKEQELFLDGTAPVEVDPTVHWEEQLPNLPGLPWAPPGSLPPSTPPAEVPQHQFPLLSPTTPSRIQAPWQP